MLLVDSLSKLNYQSNTNRKFISIQLLIRLPLETYFV